MGMSHRDNNPIEFEAAFEALMGHRPLRWQVRLFGQFSSRQIPRICELPTGLGKTSVIPIWTIALARQALERKISLPRRLVYVVNRRTVVDQATNVVERIRERLLDPSNSRWSSHERMLLEIGLALRSLASTQGPLLAVSTLRGELADNEDWKVDPARPAIVVGTIDMIGSKLLFSGYGDGRYWRAQHAGLVGQDSLIVHDEAHLTPAFSDLLHLVAEVQRKSNEPRPIHVMELSATSRGSNGATLSLTPEDETDDVVRARLDAKKLLHLHPAGRGEALDRLVKICMEHENTKKKVLVYLRLPEDAEKVAHHLNSALKDDNQERTALLTGTIRGYERDRLVREEPVYQAFLNPDAPVDHTIYFVSTSAGEIGIDIDADHLVCDTSTLDSMIQRLGRVNRRGGTGREARVDVVIPAEEQSNNGNPSTFEEAIRATKAILNEWTNEASEVIDVGPRALGTLLAAIDDNRRVKAFAPKPTTLPLTDILLDKWSLTTVTEEMPGRPEVSAYLHGLDNDPPETYVAWRKEITLLSEANLNSDMLEAWFDACPIEAQERLHNRTDHVKKMLDALLAAHRRRHQDRDDFQVVLLNERGKASWYRLSAIVEKEFQQLAYRTLVLPTEAGGLTAEGLLNSGAIDVVADVAEVTAGNTKRTRRERWVLTRQGGIERYDRLMGGECAESPMPALIERERIILSSPFEGAEEVEDGTWLLLMSRPAEAVSEGAEAARMEQTLKSHSERIGRYIGSLAGALLVQDHIKEELVAAGKWHDQGKDRLVWQRYARNPDLTNNPLAKSPRYLDGRSLGGYRHEFGSLLDAREDMMKLGLPDPDLILHLIAAHHGWARPHFERSAQDNTHTTAENEEAAAEVMRRFGRLQQRFGRWGLAWMEALVRCADIAASKPDVVLPPASEDQGRAGA